MFFNFEPNFIEKFLRKSGFSNFGHVRKTKICFLAAILKQNVFLIVLFTDIWLFWVYTHMVQVSYRNSYRKVLKNEWVQVDPSPRFFAQTGVKSSFKHLSVKLSWTLIKWYPPSLVLSPTLIDISQIWFQNWCTSPLSEPLTATSPPKKKKKWDSLPHKSNIILSFRNNTVSERFGIILLWNVSEK